MPSLPFEIVLERLAIDHWALHEAVLGIPAALRVEAKASVRKSHDILASLRIERSDGMAGRVHGEIRYEPARRHLSLEFDAAEPSGGLLARALELPDLPALSARVGGTGPLDGWRGSLEIDLVELGWVKADLELADLRDLQFELTGESGMATPSTELPWSLLDPRAPVQC